MTSRLQEPTAIAIIGMGCRYPAGANSPEELWNVVCEGRSGWSEVPPDRFNHQAFYHPDPEAPGAINQMGGHFISQDIASFDPGFFGIPQPEAETLDPQQRVVLETAWEAVENAGIPMHQLKGSNTGIFVAMFGHDFDHVAQKDPISLSKYHNLGVARPLLANRVSYVFDLQGPSVTLDTACSGSLVAVNSACQSLRSGESSMALAGGVGLIFSPDQMALMSMTGLFNDQGRSYTFDSRGNGYGRGEGVGVVVLKRLDSAIRDGDNIRAIIRSSGANSDGRTNGIMLPNQNAQARLARNLFRDLPFTPLDIQYAEAHGTGTKAGDDVEMKTIRNVFCSGRKAQNPIYVGATKPNIGHSEAASGVAGLIKTVLAMENGMIPPNILLETFKPGLEPDHEILRVARTLTPWPSSGASRKAVVNSFGFGGTNAMVVLESPTICDKTEPPGDQIPDAELNGVNREEAPIENANTVTRLFAVTATSEVSLGQNVNRLREYLERKPRIDLDSLSFTLTSRRSAFQWRSSIIASDLESLKHSLDSPTLPRNQKPLQIENVFIFTGQGAQAAKMGFHLLKTKENEFIRSISRSDHALKALGAKWNLVEELSRDHATSLLNDSRYGQPASTAIQLALVDILRSWKVLPAAVIGHSSGEIAAAYAAGVVSQSEAIRIAYHRGFLAGMATQRNSQPGGMLAVGLGQDDIQGYIDDLQQPSAVTIACMNSPSSTTVSGDANVISELKIALDRDGVFSRSLKVDTAYHSHHMASVGKDYLDLLQDLKKGSVDSSTSFFSTVTGEEKKEGFDSTYWVQNLISPVNFLASLQNLCRGKAQLTINLIEIGPHSALAGPIRQTMDNLQADYLSYNYLPTLIRGENSVESIMNTGSTLFRTGSDLDIRKVASLGISRTSELSFLKDLPSYHWNHSITHWSESRLSREHRFRTHAAHDLLGSRVVCSSDSQPSWRLLLSFDRLPWLRDHMVDDFVVFPAAGYITMAIEAMRQINDNQNPGLRSEGYRLKDVSFRKSLTLPKDGKPIETIISFRRSFANEAWIFTISSVTHQGKWHEHCDGTIRTMFCMQEAEIREGEIREQDLFQKAKISQLESARIVCETAITHRMLYDKLAATGNQYGPAFAINTECRLSNLQSLHKVIIPDIGSTMPGRFLQPHVVHPTTLDGIIQACLPVYQQHSVQGSVMPIRIGDLFVSTNIESLPEAELEVVCDLTDTLPHSTSFRISTFQKDKSNRPRCVLTIDNGEIRVIGETHSSAQKLINRSCSSMEWGLHRFSVTAESFESIVMHLQSDEVGMSQAEKVNLGSVACARYIDWAVRDMRTRKLTVKDDHRVHWWRLLEEFFESQKGQELIQQSPDTRSSLDELTSKMGVEGEAIAKIGPELVNLLTGKTDPLTHFLEDDLIFRVYHSDEGARPNRYMAEYVKHLTFQRRDLKILEIGAGTGGTTLQVLQACSPGIENFCAEYMYTDISSGFFEAVRTTKLKPWAQILTFQTLDLEKDATEQGFKECWYDLVIAANVVHATRSIQDTLHNIRQLLKPGGVLGLVELTSSTPYINMTFGSIPGWWSGIHEGRTDSPLLSAEQWNENLLKASFSGIDIAAYDLPEPERHCGLLISTAVGSLPALHQHSRRIKILHSISDCGSLRDFTQKFGLEMERRGFKPSFEYLEDSSDDNSDFYIIMDSASKPLLTHASSEQFQHVTSLLSKATKVYWISFAADSEVVQSNNALAVGVSRTARNENPYLDCVTIDVRDSLEQCPDQILHNLSQFIIYSEVEASNGQPRELELFYNDGKMKIQRLVPNQRLATAASPFSADLETIETPFHQEDRALKVTVGKPGLLGSLVFVGDNHDYLRPDEVEIKSYAWGINFSDVFIALGELPPTQPMVGESAGIISAVGRNFSTKFKQGDRVVAMFGTPYSSRTRTNGHLVHHIPESLSFTKAASIPLTFATAYHSLFDCANLKEGQSILIHSASGALGQAAVKISQQIGATIFATVSNPSKRRLLKEQYGIPESHIFSSRTTDFAQSIKRLTNGVGVDVVLNSLSGPLLHASWEVVAPFGHFVEVGKTDIYKHSQLNMKPFENNLSFSSVDLVKYSRQRPEYCQQLLQRIFTDIGTGQLTLLPVTVMPLGEIESAFRLIQSRKHTGKIILEATDESTVIAKAQPLRLRSDGTYVIVGGLGGLGRLICQHIQDRGARYIALFSRQKLKDSEKREIEQTLTGGTEAVVRIITCDVADSCVVADVAKTLKNTMPPIRGIIHGGMVLSDRTISQITQKDFDVALRPKCQGTINLCNSLYSDDIDFFINLSSLCGIVGTLGQSNYAAGGVFQDMFTHAQVTAGHTKFVTIDLPLIKKTYSVTQEHTHSLARQGVQLLPLEEVLPMLDYVMKGQASLDGIHQIAFGLDPEAFIGHAKHDGKIPPLLCHVISDSKTNDKNHSSQPKLQTAEEKISLAVTLQEAEDLVFLAVRDKIASLTALDSQELDLNPPIANLALDSLVATELKNWITNNLRARVQTSDIMDAQSIRSLSSLIANASHLLNIETMARSEHITDIDTVNNEAPHDTQGRSKGGEETLPKYPLRTLESTLNHFFNSVVHLGSQEELKHTRQAIYAFLEPGSIGQKLQSRLEQLSGEAGENDEVVDMYVRNKWLRGRDWRPRLRNFFATLPGQDIQRKDQAKQAARISLAAYKYKKSIDAGTVGQDSYNEQALDMTTVHWLFSSNRTPGLGCDRCDRFPESNYIVVLNKGHAYKVPLDDLHGKIIEYDKLKSVFELILQETHSVDSPVSLLTSANRDEWAKFRQEIKALNTKNAYFVETIEQSVFIVNLEHAAPETARERASVFLLDDSSNRWLDKTLSFIVCANGVSSIWGEHTMVDGTTFDGLIKAISAAINEIPDPSNGHVDCPSATRSDFTYLPIILPPATHTYINTLRAQHQAAHEGFTLANFTLTSYAATYLRQHKLPPKSVIQLVVQIAVRRLLGHNPLGAVDVISQRPFRGGRTDMIYIMTPSIQAFCAAAEDGSVDATKKRKLLLEAVKSHAKLVTMSTQGWGFRWHLMALRELLEPGEEAPVFYQDRVFTRTSERPVCTSFTEFGLPEMGRCQPHKADIWVGVQVMDNSVQFTVINGEGISEELVGHLGVAAQVMKGIIDG